MQAGGACVTIRVMPLLALLLTLALAPLASAEALLAKVAPDSGMARAGLRDGDALLDADGVAISNIHNLRFALKEAERRGDDTVTLRYRRGGVVFKAEMKLDPDGFELLANDPPDRLHRALLELPRHRDSKRAAAALVGQLDLAPGVGDRLVTEGLALWHEGKAREGKSRLSIAGFVGQVLTGEVAKLGDGPRRRRLEAQTARLGRRMKLAGMWNDQQRQVWIYANRYQKIGLNALMNGLRPDLAHQAWAKAALGYRKVGDADNEVVVLTNMAAMMQRHHRDPRAAMPLLVRARALIKDSRLPLSLPRVALLTGTLELLARKPAEASAALLEGLEAATSLGMTESRLLLSEALGSAAQQQRQLALARQRFAAARELAEQDRDRIRLDRHLAQIDWMVGDARAAARRLETALLQAREGGMLDLQLLVSVDLGRALADTGALDDLLDLADQTPWPLSADLRAQASAARARQLAPRQPLAALASHAQALLGWRLAVRPELALRGLFEVPDVGWLRR